MKKILITLLSVNVLLFIQLSENTENETASTEHPSSETYHILEVDGGAN
ncbi:MAG: hypothetical protein ACRC5C_10600 [Bacilli bacterium]